jgi:hypothetical protein
MAVVSIAFGWLVAGGFLEPIRAITSTARAISATCKVPELGHWP